MDVIDAGIAGIESFLKDYKQSHRADSVGELIFLRRWRRELISELAPDDAELDDGSAEADPLVRLNSELESAIGAENYEEAARLRDEIQRLTDPPPPTGRLR